jgi:hypothetical protein
MIGTMPTLDEMKQQFGGDNRNAELMYYQTFLAHTDYIDNKIIEGAATKEDYADLIKQREEARQKLDELMQTDNPTQPTT